MAGMLLVNWLANSNLFVTKKERETGGKIKRGAFIIVLRETFSERKYRDKMFYDGQYDLNFNEI